jgi:hypothetical protein
LKVLEADKLAQPTVQQGARRLVGKLEDAAIAL